MGPRRSCILVLCLFLPLVAMAAQDGMGKSLVAWYAGYTASTAPALPALSSAGVVEGGPVLQAEARPYQAEEFPAWLWRTRRFEIVALGVFPFALFYTRSLSDLYRYVSRGYDSRYAPWPFKNELSYQPSDQEQVLSLVIAGGLSVLFATVDSIIHNRNQARESAR